MEGDTLCWVDQLRMMGMKMATIGVLFKKADKKVIGSIIFRSGRRPLARLPNNLDAIPGKNGLF